MNIPLYITGDGIPVCEAHLQRYIDDPSWLATTCEYDAWLNCHGEHMTCKRCKGAAGERVGDSLDVAFLDANGA